MKIFAKLVFGFNPTKWPTISFGYAGSRDKLLQQSEIDDEIIFIGTKGRETNDEDKGRILGIAQISRIAVDTLSVLRQEDIDSKSVYDFDEHGNFRWPKSLLMIKAWDFTARPLATQILKNRLPMNIMAEAVILDGEDSKAIMRLERKEITLPESPALNRLRTIEVALRHGRPTTGIAPTAWKKEVERTVGNLSYTYAMRFGNSDFWKIGHTTNLRERLNDVQKHVPHEFLNMQWKVIYQQKWPDEDHAYKMEQSILTELSSKRTVGERLKCSEKELSRAWQKGIGAS